MSLKLVHLNCNGWTAENRLLRENILNAMLPDIICLNETHLRKNEMIYLREYQWIGFNRKYQKRNATRVGGGVGIFVKQCVAKEFTIKIMDRSFDGILVVELKHKMSDLSIILITCYLPPENSKYGKNAQGFFDHIVNEVYKYGDSDLCILTGDLNARIGKLSDTVENVDFVSKRHIVDNTVNQHGHSLIDFLQESRMCVLNGRFDESKNDFTSVSSKGTAVVDYIITDIKCLSMFNSFEVQSCYELIEQCKLQPLVGQKCKVPDHNVLTCTFNINVPNIASVDIAENALGSKKERYKYDKMPENFLGDESGKQKLLECINMIEQCRDNQSCVDNTYNVLCESILSEMHEKIPKVRYLPMAKRKQKFRKPFWNDDLDLLF